MIERPRERARQPAAEWKTQRGKETTEMAMADKPKKTRDQLQGMLMTELRNHPECNNVDLAAVVRPNGKPWDFVVVRDRPSISAECRARISEISSKLRAKYDLAN
jgi:hypothetical protein